MYQFLNYPRLHLLIIPNNQINKSIFFGFVLLFFNNVLRLSFKLKNFTPYLIHNNYKA